MKTLLTTLALISVFSTAAQAQTDVEQTCSAAAEIAIKSRAAILAGATEDDLMQAFREKQIYSGWQVWAANRGINSTSAPEWVVRGEVFRDCKKMAAGARL